jgi:hypothetical protein
MAPGKSARLPAEIQSRSPDSNKTLHFGQVNLRLEKSPQDIGAKVKVAMPTWHPDSDPLPEEETMPGHQWQGGFLVEGPGKGNLPYEVSGMATTEKSPEPEMMAIAHCWTSKDAQKIADALNAT